MCMMIKSKNRVYTIFPGEVVAIEDGELVAIVSAVLSIDGRALDPRGFFLSLIWRTFGALELIRYGRVGVCKMGHLSCRNFGGHSLVCYTLYMTVWQWRARAARHQLFFSQFSSCFFLRSPSLSVCVFFVLCSRSSVHEKRDATLCMIDFL